MNSHMTTEDILKWCDKNPLYTGMKAFYEEKLMKEIYDKFFVEDLLNGKN